MVTGKATPPNCFRKMPATEVSELVWKERGMEGRTGPSVGQPGQWGRQTEGHGNSQEEEVGNRGLLLRGLWFGRRLASGTRWVPFASKFLVDTLAQLR